MKKTLFSSTICFLIIGFLTAGCSSEKENSVIDENIRIYSNTWDEIANKGNLQFFDSAFAPTVIYDNVTTHLQGIDAVRKYFSEYVTGFSNRDFKVLEIYGQGDHVIKRWSFTGTHTGDFAGIKPTGKRITVEGVTIARMANGKITEERDYADDLGLMQKLGVIPPL